MILRLVSDGGGSRTELWCLFLPLECFSHTVDLRYALSLKRQERRRLDSNPGIDSCYCVGKHHNSADFCFK